VALKSKGKLTAEELTIFRNQFKNIKNSGWEEVGYYFDQIKGCKYLGVEYSPSKGGFVIFAGSDGGFWDYCGVVSARTQKPLKTLIEYLKTNDIDDIMHNYRGFS